MAKIVYKYKNQTYGNIKSNKYNANHMQGTVLSLAVIVVILAIVCISLNLTINRSATENGALSGEYAANSVYEPVSTGNAVVSNTTTSFGETSSLPAVNYPGVLKLYSDDSTVAIGGAASSEYAIVVDCNSGHIIASKNGQKRVYPASLTKVMSVVVAYEYMLENDVDIMSTYLSVSKEILDYTYKEGASNANFKLEEQVRIHDVFHGAILPSGADAILMLADFCYGGEKEFVDAMNNKILSMGLENTHYVTSTGLHDDDHYSTVSDLAVMLDYACRYDYIRELMQLTTYKYPETNLSDERSTSSTLYRWRVNYSSNISKSLVEGAANFGGKSGYTSEGKCCLSTFAFDEYGNKYIVVTCYASSGKNTVADYLTLYDKYCAFND